MLPGPDDRPTAPAQASSPIQALVRERCVAAEPGAAEPPRPGSWARRCSVAALGLLTFVAGASVVRHACETIAPGSPFDADSVVRHKVEDLRRHTEDVDLLFVGTSRVYRQLDSELFDARLTELGRPVASYNFGLNGMRHIESRHTVRRLLRSGLPRLRWLVIELTGEITHDRWGLMHERDVKTTRNIEWHTPALTLLVLRGLADAEIPLGDKLAGSWVHARRLGLRLSNLGLAVRVVDAYLHGAPLALPHRAGFLPFEAEEAYYASVGAPFDSARMRIGSNWLDGQVGKLRRHASDVPPPSLLAASLATQVAEVRARGVEPIYVKVPPHWYEDVSMYSEQTPHDLPHLIDLTDPDRYPQFYRRKNYFNGFHLNTHGAEMLTRALADRVAAVLAEVGG